MIALLRGHVAAVATDSLVVDVAGVGYRVYVPAGVVGEHTVGAPVLLHTQLIVRENEMTLYGAADQETLALFLQLLTVSGVGPRLAMAMLSTMSATALAEAIANEDVAALTSVSGVGRKTAQRVILDLRGKLDSWALGDGAGPAAAGLSATDAEAIAALAALGYTAAESRRALASAGLDPSVSVEARVFAALRVLGGGA